MIQALLNHAGPDREDFFVNESASCSDNGKGAIKEKQGVPKTANRQMPSCKRERRQSAYILELRY